MDNSFRYGYLKFDAAMLKTRNFNRKDAKVKIF